MNRLRIPRTLTRYQAVALVLGVVMFGWGVWSTTQLVLAFNEMKRVHIFPTEAVASGWQNPERALSQELPDQAPFGSFTRENAAYIRIEGASAPGAGASGSVDLSTLVPTSETASSTPESETVPGTSAEPSPVQQVPAEDDPVPQSAQMPAEGQTDQAPVLVETTASAPEAPAVLPAPEIVPQLPQEPAPAPASDVPQSSVTPVQVLARVARNVFERLIPIATASTTADAMDATQQPTDALGETLLPVIIEGASTTITTSTSSVIGSDESQDNASSTIEQNVPAPQPEDTASCVVTGKPCHTIQLSGFGVEGGLMRKRFAGAELRFSFANISPETLESGGRLLVRYYHAGRWRQAGEVFLEREVSNRTNGGYFMSKLQDVDDWRDLSDVKVVIEYLEGDAGTMSELYLDAVWIDALYRERAQDVIDGDAETEVETPENVTEELNGQNADASLLIMDDGGRISFPYVDNLRKDSLMIRADRISYQSPGPDVPRDVYVSVTNTTDEADTIRLFFSFPGGQGNVADVSRYVRNVPTATSTPVRHDVTYFCESLWQQATTSSDYVCDGTGEVHACTALNEEGNNCFVPEVEIDTATSTEYAGSWVPLPLDTAPSRPRAVARELPRDYRITVSSNESVALLPGQTAYFKVTLVTPDSVSQRFVISALGRGGFGDLDSLRLKSEASWSVEAKVSRKLTRARINEQLSTKSDFSVDERPQFRFKFKTQRGFFSRVKDFLIGRDVPFAVEDALLTHAGGSIEHIPVDIEYAAGDEWILKLAKPPRAFRPGRYTVELTMQEEGRSYTDTVEFYWGVLAINPDKWSYAPGETAKFSLAALDDSGNTMCDAQLSLAVSAPDGETIDVPVVSGGGCGFNNVTDLPDYVAELPLSVPGEYTITVSHRNENDEIINETTDAFVVDDAAALSLRRTGPTRIYPVSSYPFTLTLSAQQAFRGTVTEVLPEGFIVAEAGRARVIRDAGVIRLEWDVALDPGQSVDLPYRFKAPEVSPYLYLTGPSTAVAQDGMQIYAEGRTWKIASDALPIATGVAWLAGTTTTAGGTNISSTTAYALSWGAGSDYDTTYFSHSTSSNNSQLTVNVAGDYLVALTLPVQRSDTNQTRTTIEADIRVNGGKQNVGVGRSAFIRTISSHSESSDHLYVLLRNLQVGDYIESFVQNITTATDAVTISSQASLYAEYIDASQTVYFAVGTTTTSGDNLNAAATSSMKWFDDSTGRKDTGYTHSNSASSENVTLAAAGDYLVFVNIPTSGAVTNASIRGRVRLNGVIVPAGDFRQGYIDNNAGATASSIHWSGVVRATTTNTVLTVAMLADATVGTTTVGNDQASIYVQKLPSADVFLARGTALTGGTDWDVTPAQSVQWATQDIIDTSAYTHSTTSNSHQVTVDKSGDYLLAFNSNVTNSASNARSNEVISVLVNGAARAGGVTKTHFIRGNTPAPTHNKASGSFVYLLRDLVANDVVTITSIIEANAGTVTSVADSILALWRKQAQSSYIQSITRWYVNTNAQTPTDPWPSGGTDLDESEAITTGNSVKSSDVLRLRMAMRANVATVAATDSFKLQYAAGETCTPALSWSDVGSSSASTIWRGYDNAATSSGTTLSSLLLSVSSTTETYEEQALSVAAPNALSAGQNGEWDWVVQNNSAPSGASYCFRVVMSNGQTLKDYEEYPQLVTNAVPDAPELSKLFDNEKVASTTPWFDFTSSDDNDEDLHYQIQVSSDPAFGTTVIDRDSQTYYTEFENVNDPSDKSPFFSAQTVRFKPTTALSNNTTYWWRVRARDPSGTNGWSDWSSSRSFTVDTAVTVTTWFQTTKEQFNTGTMTNVGATSTNDVSISSGTSGTLYSPAINYSDKSSGNSWGSVSWSHSQPSGASIIYQVEYYTSTSSWALIPNADLPNNTTGTSTSPISLTSLDPETYGTIRVRATFSRTTATPRLSDWTVAWALSVAAPTLTKLFDNEKTGTTTPTFQFYSTDPHGDDLVYQIQWSTDPTFVSGVTTRTSDTNVGFANVASSTDTSPFISGNTVRFTVQPSDALTNSTTYWWRVRAKDPGGGNAYSLWSSTRSFTTDTSVIVSTWFQTTTAQFQTDTLTRTAAASNAVTASSDTGKIAIYRSATAGEAITTAVFNNGWDTTVRQDNIFSLSGTTSVVLARGYYAVLYGARFDSSSGTNRSEVQSYIDLGGTALPQGWSQGFIRRNGGSNEGYTSGGAIVYASADNTLLKIRSFRTDTNGTAGVVRVNNTSGVQLIRLDDAWSYVRLSKTGKQSGPTSASWVSVTYDRQDELDTATFGHSVGGSAITLKEAGHYLVFANTYGSLTTNTNTTVNQKLKLDNMDIPGSFTTVYMRGNNNADGDYQGAAAIGMIIQSTTTNQVLTVQLSRSLGTASWTINGNQVGSYVDRTGVTIVKLPEGDFTRVRETTNPNLNPAALTALIWNTEDEEDSSFSHSTSSNTSRFGVTTSGDYLFLAGHYAAPGTTANAEYNQGWRLNGGTMVQYGQSIAYNATAASYVGAWSGNIFPSLVNGDYVEVVTQALGSAGTVAATQKSVQGVRIGSLAEADTNPKTLVSSDIVFSDGTGPKWQEFSWSDTEPGGSSISYQIFYLTASSTYALIPDSALPGNSSGFTTSPVDLSGVSRVTYATLRTQATFTCSGGNCPTLNDWTVKWSEGINVSGTAKAFDQTASTTSGTVAIAVNGVLQSGKTGTISNGSWSISNVTAFQDDIITVFVQGAATSSRAIGITKYDGDGDMTGIQLFERHLSLGSADNPTLSNADLSQYDNSVSGSSDLFHEVDGGGDLNVCVMAGCADGRLYIRASTTFRPNSSTARVVTTPNIQIAGELVADGNTINVSRSWKNTGVFTKGSSAVVFTATSTTESIDSSVSTSSSFHTITFGSGSGTARWNLISPLSASSTVTITYGTLAPGATSTIALGGDLMINANGLFAKHTASTTFTGSGTNTWTDNTAGKQDLGEVIIDGTSKTVNLGSGVKATNITIGSNDTLDAVGSYTIEVTGNWTNSNVFQARTGTVNFTATTTGKTIQAGSSSFYNIAFNGVGGNWAFSGSTVTAGNDFTIATGTVTMPTATTTVAGSFDASSGTFMHNNGVVLLTTAGTKTVRPGASSFYDLAFDGSGSWSFPDSHATSSRHTIITLGSVTLPAGTLAVGGSFHKNGGSFTANSNTLRFTAADVQSVRFGGTSAYNLTFAGSGSWSFVDAAATSTGTVRLENGTTTLPSGSLAVTGSFIATSGTFAHNNGLVYFNATTTGKTISPGSSSFYDALLGSSAGGWTLAGSATSTRNFTLSAANSFTVSPGVALAVQGTFTNSVGGAATTWTNSTLSLSSASAFSINTKTAAGDTYGTINVASGAAVKMWNSSAATTTVASSAYLYSQDHAAQDGDLYIWGSYTAPGSEYWAYGTDFDGASLSGSERQVDVRIATGSVISLATSTITGISTATTTIANQGTGTFALSVTGGTLTASYYQIRHMGAAGLSLSGSPVVASLADGDLELAVSGGSLMTLAASVINANPALQIQRVRFATSTGALSGTNVTESGSPSSYWWFRNHYGDIDGEAFDTDPAGDPGYVRWEDSSFVITIDGTVYADHGPGGIGNPPCDGSTPVVTILVGANTYTGSCNAGSGVYSIPGVTFTGDVTVTAYLNTNGGKRAVTVTKTPTANIPDLDLYQNTLIVRHEGVTAMTIADLAFRDSSDDSDIFFTAATGSPDTLTTAPNTELHIWAGKTFAPGGNVTLQSGGSGDARDGRLHLGVSAVFTAAGAQSHSIGGGFTADSGATFTAANSTITFTATTTGKSIQSAGPVTFYDVVFNGAGGGWSLDSAGSATTTVHTLTLTAGTLSGTGDMIVQTGGTTGGGTITMTGGTFRFDGTGNFGNSNPWQFRNLALGPSALGTTTKTGSATTTVTGVLSIAAGYILEAGASPWVLSGGGTPLAVGGTFTVQTAPFWFTATSSATIADETYAALYLAPAGSGSPTFTLMGGGFVTGNLYIGDGSNAVTVTADSNDPSFDINGDMLIRAGATFVASNVGSMTVAGSWTNAGTFTHSNAEVVFDAGSTGRTVSAGSSAFYDVRFNNASGGWTLAGSATSTRNFTLSAANSFTVSPGVALAVGGTFTNMVGGGATTWTDSTLYLNAGSSYSLNTKTASGDTYGTLLVGNATHVRSWSSSAATTTVSSSGSLYSQDHAAVDGDLYIWGAYSRASGSDYWSYATDFDGTDISTTSPRQVDVRIATGSSVTLSGGLLDIVGISSATTTIANQGAGTYAFAVSGGTFNAQYYQVRDTNASGIALSGTPAIGTLSDGDYELSVSGGTMLTVAGTVIDANPLEISMRNRFATSTAVATGTNVTVTGTPGSAWKFNLHYGNRAGEAYDFDTAGDPGYVIWDDSAAQVSISGNVYADEGSSVSSACDGATQNVRLVIQGVGVASTTCSAATGFYTFAGISYNPGDSFIVYLNTNGGVRAANVSQDPVTSIADMHLYQNRVIVRHEDSAPLTIADMAVYDSSDDGDILFTAVDAGTDTLTLPPNTKLIVWGSKTFAPAGNITLQSGGSGNAWDGTLEVRAGGALSLAGAQSHSIGGSFTLGAGATMTAASSTFTFTATTTGKTIALSGQSFYNLAFSGTGGNWAFASSSATSTNDVTITAGTVTLPSDRFVIGGSFENTGGTFMHNNGTLYLVSESAGETIRTGSSALYNLTTESAAGAWAFADTNATSSNTVSIQGGTLTLPSGTFAVGGSFLNPSGAFTHNAGTVKLTAAAQGKQIQASTSPFANLTLDGVGGAWSFLDTNATTTGNVTITNGSTTLPTGTFAVGGSFTNAGTFEHASGTVKLIATATGKTINPGASSFHDVRVDSTSGGWTITGNATSTRDFTIAAANSFAVNASVTLAVQGAFTNSVGGGATTWTNSTLYLASGTGYDANLKTDNGDAYGTLVLATSTKVRMWKSSAATTTTVGSASLYSQDHAGVDGDLYIFGAYSRTTGSDYWSYATDFDGAALGGGTRQVDVRIATGSSVSYSGGSLAIVGIASATTTIASSGTGTYAFSVAGGTLNANYYSVRNTDTNGLSLSGAPAITSLSYGDFELGVTGGSMLTVAGTVIDANASQQFSAIRFATSSGVSSGYNVTKTGSASAGWTFAGHYGNYDGESFDQDGGDACGSVRWDDSACLFVSQQHFRWRNDDGGEGAPDSEWMSASWSRRKKIAVSNPNASGYTNYPVRVVVEYDSDMQGDFDDLRFTDASGTTTLSYWIENSVVSASSTVWVEVPSLPASGSATVYMYYGNVSATSSADGSSTFSFFESFESDSLAAYSGDTSLFDTDTTFNYSGSYGLDAGANVTQKTTNGIYRTGSLTSTDQTIRYYQYVDASQQDEPCTLFGVGGSGSNYAVCLDAYPSQRLVIAKNVTSNDESGTVLATTSVTYTTGWYEVVIDWLASGTRIAANVYTASGVLFATATSTDTSHSSGGMGFSFWGQHGGWDFYTARQYAATLPTTVFGVEQVSGGATWAAAEDATLTGLMTNQNIRLRFSVQNTGTYISGKLYRLQYAEKGAALSCEAVSYGDYFDVPTTSGGCGAAPACMTTSSQFANQASTAGLLSYPASMAFAAGQILEDPSNQTSSSTIPATTATEVEYNFQMTNNATANAYCFRVYDAGASEDLDNYQNVAEATIRHVPQITSFTLNQNTNITLTEGTSTVVVASSTVTDLNGYADILFATSSIYRSGVGAACSADDNSCYQGATTSCSFSSCAGNSCTLMCSASIRHFADPTDASSTYPGQEWLGTLAVEDSTGARDTETALGVELLTLYGLSVNVGNIDFGDLYVGQDTGAVNATTTYTNTGNAPIDIEISGTDLEAGANSIAVNEQKYATSTFIYGSCSVCQFLSGAATDVDVNLPKQTATSSPSTGNLYWGLNIPTNTGATDYTGTNTFIAIGS